MSRILSKKFKKFLNDSNILLLGMSYKKDIGDLRESQALEIIKKLEKENVNISYYDPYVPNFTNGNKEYKSLIELNPKAIKNKEQVLT